MQKSGDEANLYSCCCLKHGYFKPKCHTYQSASCISALAAWLVRILQTVRSWAATSASSIVQPNPRLRRSLWMTSIHFVLGHPRLHLPWDGFHRCSLFGIWLLSIRSRCPNHFGLQFLIKVFWSSGRPLLCFSRFWPSENVARIRRVYFAYSRTKSVHTRNIASNAKGKCVFLFWLRQMIALLHTSRGIGGQDKISWCFNERKTKLGLARMVTSKILCKRQKWGRSRPIYIHIFALLLLNLV